MPCFIKKTLPFILLLLCAPVLFGEQIALSVSDFIVESKNPDHEFIGKGVSCLLAAELARSARIMLIDREARQEIMKEQEFSLSDLADESKQIMIGRMLAAQYIVMGRIIDMAGSLVISLRLVHVETVAIKWQDTLTDTLARYDYISAWFARGILGALGVDVTKITAAKIENKEEKKAETVVRISEGLDSQDRGQAADSESKKGLLNYQEAYEKYRKAIELDPKLVESYFLAVDMALYLLLYPEARELLVRVREVIASSDAGDIYSILRADCREVRLLKLEKKYGEAVLLGKQAIALIEKGGYAENLIFYSLLTQIVETLNTQCKNEKTGCDQVLLYLEKARRLLVTLKMEESLEYAIILRQFGRYYYALDEFDEALRYFDLAQKLLKKIKRTKSTTYAFTLIDYARVYEKVGSESKAKRYYKEAYSLLMEMGLEERAKAIENKF